MRYKKPILVGVALALFAGPASWIAANAQSDPFDGQVASESAAAVHNRLRDHGQTSTSKTSDTGNKAAATASSSKSKTDKPADKKAASKKATTPATPPVAPKPKPAPAPAPPAVPTPVPTPTGVHDNIISTIFWVGEAADASNANITNTVSAWDEAWQTHYGGVDDPNNRNGYYPAAFVPHENPFYFALPYSDFDNDGNRRASAGSCPNAATLANQPYSWCKNAWIKITHGGKTTYAQWQDTGPLEEDDTAYVFGSARPRNTWGAKAGIDVSPAVKTYLGLQDVDTVSWSFVSASSVPAGPWRDIVTTSLGT